MSGGRNRDRNRGSEPDRVETKVPPDNVIKEIIQGEEPEKLVKYAEEVGKGLAKNEKLTTSQIRSFFSEVKRIEGLVQQKGAVDRRRLLLLKPKLAYQAHRQIESHKGWGVAKLEEVLRPAIDFVGGDAKYFRNFVDFFEAILAYHKAAGGRN